MFSSWYEILTINKLAVFSRVMVINKFYKIEFSDDSEEEEEESDRESGEIQETADGAPI